ncbi:uncharacterized protein LOC126901721 isoform X2 [Daktulosphaira vitifoliae]|uniref:uncharacterized protein LOC126901721 isoform X2 n=1 Tax=Daktulosphaira vitifoliae TaxID=58002 RepID=UPI0021A97BB5|nr:uncharacterized protein LOC126901721 isoform X2 [Daktulosphaira vitifoliae]XP_050534382.1 uncharacterized protein LOC126901721 isoform X2 [Daktulosphaira vitifoliae]
MESRDCDKSSRFYIGNMLFDDNQKKNYDYMLRIVSNNKRDIEVLIDDNHRNGILQIGNIRALRTNYLYFNRFGSKSYEISNFIHSFDLRIQWGDIIKKFKDVYVNVDKLDWPTTKLRPYLLLYSMIFNLLKVMMLRLTWKQFLYIKHQDAILIVDLTDQWLLSLQEFTSFLALEKDYVIESVIESISIHIKNYPLNNDGTVDLIKLPTYQNQFTDKLINNISNIISTLCDLLGCTIVENWNTEEVLQISNQVTFYSDRILHNKSIDETTESDEITDSNYINNSISVLDCVQQDFGRYLSYLFKRVNFNIIRSFIEYLETLNTYNLFDE